MTDFEALQAANRYTLDALVDAAKRATEVGEDEKARVALLSAEFLATQMSLIEMQIRTNHAH
jgi:hypothetical protein